MITIGVLMVIGVFIFACLAYGTREYHKDRDDSTPPSESYNDGWNSDNDFR